MRKKGDKWEMEPQKSSAAQFRKWANEIVSQYTIRGYVLESEAQMHGENL